MPKAPPKLYTPFGGMLFIFICILDAVCISVASKVPYLLDVSKRLSWFWITFPPLIAFLGYFGLFHVWQTTGKTSLQMLYSQHQLLDKRFVLKEKLKALVGGAAIFSVILWYSWGSVACVAYFFSKTPVEQTFVINDLSTVGGGVDVGLVALDTKVEYVLRVTGMSYVVQTPWKVGETVCIKGRTSFFGTIVESLSVGECRTL